MIDYKDAWYKELRRREQLGISGPEPLPDSDDLILDARTGELYLNSVIERVVRSRTNPSGEIEFVDPASMLKLVKQWTVYRRRNLFIVASRTDAAAVGLARALVKGLARELPESQARFTRATDPVRIASLLATGQLDVAIVSRDEAASMHAGLGAFKEIGPVQVRWLTDLGGHLLVAVESFRERHAFLLAKAIEHLRPGLPLVAPSSLPPSIPEHPGAAAYRGGKILETEQGSFP